MRKALLAYTKLLRIRSNNYGVHMCHSILTNIRCDNYSHCDSSAAPVWQQWAKRSQYQLECTSEQTSSVWSLEYAEHR